MVLSQLQFPALTRFPHIPTQVFLTYEILVHLKTGVSNKRHLATTLAVASVVGDACIRCAVSC